MKHIHHIIPKHMGGDDSKENLIELTIEEHALAHKKLYEACGKKEDYIAWKGLEGSIDIEELIQLQCSLGGVAGVEILRKLKKCVFFNDDLRKIAGERGRLRSKELGKGFYDSNLQSELGKRGGPKNKGFIWINDGNVSIKYTKIMQNNKSIEEFILENPQFKIGRLLPNPVECPHCKRSGIKSAMVLWHFNNCKERVN